MAYVRKTRDVWIVEIKQDGGWHIEYFAKNMNDAHCWTIRYRVNHPGQGTRTRKIREKIERSDP